MKGNSYWRKKTEISRKMWGTVSKRQRGTMKTTLIKGSKTGTMGAAIIGINLEDGAT